MRVIAVIDDPRVMERILRLLGDWQDPPRRAAHTGHSTALHQRTVRGCGPDYESVLTD
ncbi:MAG: hypothetical protein NT154_38810 [Verrucomicrobia bacterium]|nr:hypothetical protein [Verrucomicrobiota bacterium]